VQNLNNINEILMIPHNSFWKTFTLKGVPTEVC